MRSVRGLLRRLGAALRDDAPAPHVYIYTRSQTTIRGTLVGRDAEAYILEHAEVAPEGAAGFRQVRERVRVPRAQVDYYTCSGGQR